MVLRPSLTIACALLLSELAAAQLAQPGRPASARRGVELAAEIPATLLPAPDVARYLAEDEARGNWPYRYGARIATTVGCDDAGTWEELAGGDLVWRLRLVSPGARSLGVLFGEYELPDGGQLFVYDRKRTQVLGAFTRATRQPNGMLAVAPVIGDELVLEYVQPARVSARPKLRLAEVVHDYRGILDAVRVDAPQALTGGCLVDINCPQGAAFQDIKRSVVLVLFGGVYCSAALLNNTARDSTPYFLTANHCGDMTNGVAVFGYENAGCASGGASQSNTISGATLLAATTQFDSQLYLLSSTPPPAFSPYFAGWDRGTSQPGAGISISHPNALPKKLAVDNDSPLLSSDRWVVAWEFGKLEPGSSGSPLFNGAQRVLGPACCVSDFSCRGQLAFYGLFKGFWQQRNLAQWLDPLGANPPSLDGYDPVQAFAVPYYGSGVNLIAYTSTSPPGVGTTWNAVIDTTIFPGITGTWIIGHPAPSAGHVLPLGELLVNVATPRLFTSVAPSTAGNSLHSNAIPPDPTLIGQVVYTQGVIFAGAPLLLTNGVELHLK